MVSTIATDASKVRGTGAMVIAVLALPVIAAAIRLPRLGLRARRRDTATEAASDGISLVAAVSDFIEAAYSVASETDEQYVAAVGRLRRDPERAVREIETSYRSVGDDQIHMRESLLLAANALAHPSSLPLLVDVAREPVRGTASHDGGPVFEESVLKLIAVDGIEAIARTGDDAAADALVTLAASPDRAVQAAAVVALKYADAHRGRYEELRNTLPEDRQYLFDVVRANVDEVPQIDDPRRHLLAQPTTADARPDPASGERRGELPGERARPPRAQRNE
jgi:HEAT repeat protein